MEEMRFRIHNREAQTGQGKGNYKVDIRAKNS